MAKRHFRKYALPPWLRTIRDQGEKIIFPIAVFQLVRTVIFPTTVDLILLLLLFCLYLAYMQKWI